MNIETFQELLSKIEGDITKQTTRLRKRIPPEQKPAVTLRYLATGETFESLMYQFRTYISTIAQFIPHVCSVIYKSLKEEYLTLPSCEEDWLTLVENTDYRWQFPNVWGAIDGKHVHLLHPANSGSEDFNYKGFHSIVLMAIVGFDYKFLYVNVRCQGRISDGSVFKNTDLQKELEHRQLNLPDPKSLPSFAGSSNADTDNDPMPSVIVGDDAFPLS